MKFKLPIILGLFSVLLVGCEKSTIDTTDNYSLPEGLSDCKVYYLRSDKYYHVTAIKCPNSTTSTVTNVQKQSDKITVVVDGGTFVKTKEKQNSVE